MSYNLTDFADYITFSDFFAHCVFCFSLYHSAFDFIVVCQFLNECEILAYHTINTMTRNERCREYCRNRCNSGIGCTTAALGERMADDFEIFYNVLRT